MDSIQGAGNIIDFRMRVPPALCPRVNLPQENTVRYDAVLGTHKKYTAAQTLDDLLALMAHNGVDHAVIHAEHEVGDGADALNKTVSAMVEQYPERFTGIGTVSMHDFTVKKALRQIDECADNGFIGLSLQPAFFGMAIDDRILYPVYAKAMEKHLLVAVHTGINYTTHRPMSGENPMLLDGVACDFPDLTIVAAHAGWPWVAEMVAVARKHPNVYMEFGGLAPKYINSGGSGWEMMFRFMNSLLGEQVLFGTDWPTMGPERVLEEWRSIGLKPEVLAALLGGNAKELIDKHSSGV